MIFNYQSYFAVSFLNGIQFPVSFFKHVLIIITSHFLVSFLSLVSDSGSHWVEYQNNCSTRYTSISISHRRLMTHCCVFVSQQDSSAFKP